MTIASGQHHWTRYAQDSRTKGYTTTHDDAVRQATA
jgi:hypothetical protein